MKFINLTLTLTGVALLSACAGFTSPPPAAVPPPPNTDAPGDTTVLQVETQPGVGATPSGQTNTTQDKTAEGTDPTAGPVRLPNPYLTNPRPVSGGVQKLFDRALKFHRDGNWPEAELAWQELILAAPGLSGPVLNLGLVYEATDRPELAENTYRKAIDVNGLNVNAYNQLAILKRKQGQFSEAETLYNRALRVWPDDPTSHRNIAILYDLYMGKLEQALAHYERYRDLIDEPEPALKGWIRDLQRRLDINS